MALLPCHAVVPVLRRGGRLSCQLYQRSADAFLGVPFNIASYALLTHMVAQQCDLAPGEFVWTGGDCHLYVNHLEQADLQLSRTPVSAAAADDSRAARPACSTTLRGFRDPRLPASRGHQGTHRRLKPHEKEQQHPARADVRSQEFPCPRIRRVRAAAHTQGHDAWSSTSASAYRTRVADARYADKPASDSHTFLFTVDARTVIDAGSGGNEARYINHGCDPNCESVTLKRRVFIKAIRTIQPGQELFYDYQIQRDRDDAPDIDAIFACRCGAASCRGSMLEPAKKRRAAAQRRRPRARAAR